MTNPDWADSTSYDIFKAYEHERGTFNDNDKQELIRRYAIAIRTARCGEPKPPKKLWLTIKIKIKSWWHALLT